MHAVTSVVSDSLRPHGILEWVAVPSSRGSSPPPPGDLPHLLQGIFPTQGLNSRLLHCRQIPYLLSHWGSPLICIHNLILTEHLPPASAGSSVGEKSSSGGQDPEEDDADGKGTRTAGRKSRGARSPRAKGTLRRRALPCQTLRGRTPVPTRWANRGDADPGPRGFSGVTGAEMRPQWVRGDLEMGGRGATAA